MWMRSKFPGSSPPRLRTKLQRYSIKKRYPVFVGLVQPTTAAIISADYRKVKLSQYEDIHAKLDEADSKLREAKQKANHMMNVQAQLSESARYYASSDSSPLVGTSRRHQWDTNTLLLTLDSQRKLISLFFSRWTPK